MSLGYSKTKKKFLQCTIYKHNFTNSHAKNLLKILLICLLQINLIRCDLPVHCLQSDVVGLWSLKISKNQFTPSLENEMETSCGHSIPNKVVDLSDDSDLTIPKFEEKKIFLGKDYKLYEEKVLVGTWSFVYDQSFILYYKNSVLTAPFKYYKQPGEKDAESNCGKTFLGWYIPDKEKVRSNWSCFYGVKLENELGAPENQIKNKINFLQIEISVKNKNRNNNRESELDMFIKNDIEQGHFKENKSINDLNNDESGKNDNKNDIKHVSLTQTDLDTNLNLESLLKYEQMSKIVEKLNSLDLGWKADIHPQYIGMSFAELKHRLGLNKGKYAKKSFFAAKENLSFIQLGNQNAYIPSAQKDQKEKVEQFLKTVEEQLSLISIGTKALSDNSIAKSEAVSKNKFLLINSSSNSNLINSNSIEGSSSSNKVNAKLKKNSESNSNFAITSKKQNIYSSKNLNRKDDFYNFAKEKLIQEPHIMNSSEDVLSSEPAITRDPDSSKVFDYKEISKYLNKEISEIDENKLSKNWDWRNVGGISFVPPVRSQGSCGSCYVFSTMTSLEARLRVQTNNKDQTLFSKQFPLSCNFYAEGCNGGYPILVAKFLNEFEAVPESCFEYTETTDKCSNVCDYRKLPKKYTVSKWGYLGGAYGKTSEADILKELRARGPLPGNILVHWSFHYYKKGIFSMGGLKKSTGNVSKNTLLDLGQTWSKVEHSITLVGYGEENGVKYWIGMNTWGDNWGEDGFFRIARGTNESEIESMGDFMNIKVEDRN